MYVKEICSYCNGSINSNFYYCLQLCGHDVQYSSGNESSAQETTKITSENGHILDSPPKNSRFSQSEETKDDEPLTKEFLLLNTNIPNVTIKNVKDTTFIFRLLMIYLKIHPSFSTFMFAAIKVHEFLS